MKRDNISMDNKRLFSIVVPIYNREKYIKQCLESIQKQTYKNIEIILVDDGSTDDSRKICENIANFDTRIHYYYKENGGVSSARNLGLKKANGEFISFVDSDDFVDELFIERMLEKMDINTDMVVLGQYRYIEEEKNSIIIKPIIKAGRYTSDEIKKVVIDAGLFKGFTVPSVCSVCFRTSNIFTKNITFSENVVYNEDGLFASEYVFYSTKDIYIDYSEAHYFYRANYQSASYLVDETSPKYLLSMYNIYNRLTALIDENNNVKLQIERRYASKTINKIVSMIRSNFEYNEIKRVMTDKRFKASLKTIFFSKLTIQFKFLYILLILKMYSITYLVFKIKYKYR